MLTLSVPSTLVVSMAGRSWAVAAPLSAAIDAASKTIRWRMFLPFCVSARLAVFPRRVQDHATLAHSRRRSQVTAARAAIHLMALGMSVALAAATVAQELDREAEYRQNAPVLARYPDVPSALDTP